MSISKIRPKEEEVEHDGDLLTDDDLSSFIEWTLIAMANYLARDDERLLNRMQRDMQSLTPEETGALGNLRVDTQAAAALLEASLPIKLAIFQINLGLCTVCGSDCHACQYVYSESEAMIMQLVVLVAIVMSEAHFDKTAM